MSEDAKLRGAIYWIRNYYGIVWIRKSMIRHIGTNAAMVLECTLEVWHKNLLILMYGKISIDCVKQLGYCMLILFVL